MNIKLSEVSAFFVNFLLFFLIILKLICLIDAIVEDLFKNKEIETILGKLQTSVCIGLNL